MHVNEGKDEEHWKPYSSPFSCYWLRRYQEEDETRWRRALEVSLQQGGWTDSCAEGVETQDEGEHQKSVYIKADEPIAVQKEWRHKMKENTRSQSTSRRMNR